MKKIFTGLYYFVLLLSIVSCSKESQEQIIPESKNYSLVDAHHGLSERDAQVGQIALALTKASDSNVSLRKLIGEKALKQFDGDYDVLMTQLVNEPIEITDVEMATKAGANQMDFKSLIEAYLPAESKTKSGEKTLLERLMSEYPELQISVPVHAEDWDPETFSPPVVFDLIDQDVEQQPTIPGFDAQGNPIEMDAVNAPDYPVIVVGYNERMGYEQGRGGDDMYEIPIPPEAPTNLNYTRTNTSILLYWDQEDYAEGYKVYRRAQGASAFSLVSTIEGEDNRAYEDYDVTANMYYLYYVTAYVSYTRPNGMVLTMESDASSIISVSSPSVLPPLSEFSVRPNGTNLEFRWNNDGDVTSTVKVDYSLPSQQYQNFFSAVGQVNKIMAPPVRGQRVSFMAYRQNSLGMSDAVYDFIYPPYRNTATSSPVNVCGVKYNIDPEGWFKGKPDFYLTVHKIENNGNTITPIVSDLFLPVSTGVGQETVYSGTDIRHILSWSGIDVTTLWYSELAFALIEKDLGTYAINLTYSPKLAIKYKDILSLELSPGISIQIPAHNYDEDCGQAYYLFYENPEIQLLFHPYQVYLRLTE